MAKELTYGRFPGGDPRLFKPDMQVCYPEEVEAWREACHQWDRGKTEPEPASETIEMRGQSIVMVSRSIFGWGTWEIDMPEDDTHL